MIVEQKIEIKVSNKVLKHYREYFKNIKSGDIIDVNPFQLPNGSNKKIKVKCSVCEIEKKVVYYDYNKITKNNTELYYCKDCKNEKTKKTLNKLYGVENVFQLCKVKEKTKKTCVEKYGVEHHLQNKNILQKQKNTNKKRYGVEYQMQLSENKNKSKKTSLLKYGTKTPSESDEVKQTVKSNNFKKYNVEYTSQLESVINKIKKSKNKTILDKYKNNGIIAINGNEYTFNCDNGHEFIISSILLYNRIKYKTTLCTVCNPINSYNISGMQIQLQNLIKKNTENVVFSSRAIITPYELDIYLPDLNLAFEFNGVYWHNELYKDKNYHKMKSDLCENKGIQLVHVWEDDWLYKKDIIESMILNKLGKTTNKIFGRKTKVSEVHDNKIIRKFLNENHIQGFVGSSVKLGLFYNDELVTLMTFGKQRKIMNSTHVSGNYEIMRFCNKLNTNVVGGASKLFKYFIRNFEFNEIVTYADRSHSNGNLYKELGFNFIHKTEPNYYYVIDGIRHYRFNFRKDKLIKEGYDSSKSEHRIMLDRKIYRIFNAGNYKFQFSK